MTDTAETLAKKFAKLRDSGEAAEIVGLIQSVEPRRVQIRARQREIAPGFPGVSVPPARAEAIAKGLEAVERLDAEGKDLAREAAYLDDLERAAGDALEAATRRKAQRELPIAKSRLPKAMAAVRSALATLDDVLAELNGIVGALAEFDRLNVPFPLSDRELASLLELRATVWQPRVVAAIAPPGSVEELQVLLPQSFELLFERGSSYDTFALVRPPRHVPMDANRNGDSGPTIARRGY